MSTKEVALLVNNYRCFSIMKFEGNELEKNRGSAEAKFCEIEKRCSRAKSVPRAASYAR